MTSIRARDVTTLSYCTNVHPVTNRTDLVAQFDRVAVRVRDQLGVDHLGLGLWLPAEVAAGLAADRTEVAKLRAELDARGLWVATMNAFPYRGFHDPVVKHAVYCPRWTDPARLTYTADCARVLADLLNEDADHGSISTLPLGWRTPWTPADDAAARIALAGITSVLRAESARVGRPLVLALEPEPGCVLDTVADAVAWLAPHVDPEHIGLCLDTCHLAVSFADPSATINAIVDAGLRVAKVQVSTALHVPDPADPAAAEALRSFEEPRYLHQVRERAGDGMVLAADDLPQAFDALPRCGPWRVHYHVPLHVAPAAPLSATTDVTVAAVSALRARTGTLPHLEVETYTWPVLPDRYRTDLAVGMADELAWARTHLLAGATR